MNTKKFLLITGIAALLLLFAVNTGFAASSEKIIPSDYKYVDDYNLKVVTITKVTSFHEDDYSNNFAVNVKKAFKSKYKIKAVNVRIFEGDEDGNETKTKIIKEKYVFKNKNKVNIKIPDSNNSTWYYLDKITIFYTTKSKIKNETTTFQKIASSSSITYFKGKKVNIVLNEKLRYVSTNTEKLPVSTSQHFKVKTINSKDKIKSVKIFFYNKDGVSQIKTVQGYGKSILNFKFSNTLKATLVGDILVRYV